MFVANSLFSSEKPAAASLADGGGVAESGALLFRQAYALAAATNLFPFCAT